MTNSSAGDSGGGLNACECASCDFTDNAGASFSATASDAAAPPAVCDKCRFYANSGAVLRSYSRGVAHCVSCQLVGRVTSSCPSSCIILSVWLFSLYDSTG